jgi:uncharacterized protein
MIKLLILFLIGYLALKAVRGVFGHTPQTRMPSGYGQPDESDDLMVQDLNCLTYISKRDAVRAEQSGKTLYFCSEKCRDAYLMKSQ